MKALYKMQFDCGRMGSLSGVFIADSEDVKYLLDNTISVDFGEVLGKHSDVSGCLANDEIELITTDENVIKVVEQHRLENGYDPFENNLREDETENVPENGVCWDDCTVKEFIDFKRKGIVPKLYEKEYNKFLESSKSMDNGQDH